MRSIYDPLSWEYASMYYGKAREKRMGVPCGAQNVTAHSQGPGVCLQHHVLHCCLTIRRKRSRQKKRKYRQQLYLISHNSFYLDLLQFDAFFR